MSNFIDFLLVISKLQSPIYRRSPQIFGGVVDKHDILGILGLETPPSGRALARPFLGVFSLCRSAAVAFAVPPSNVLPLASLLSFCGLSRAPPVPSFSPRTPSSTISNSAKGWPRSRLADYIDPTASDTPYCSCF